MYAGKRASPKIARPIGVFTYLPTTERNGEGTKAHGTVVRLLHERPSEVELKHLSTALEIAVSMQGAASRLTVRLARPANLSPPSDGESRSPSPIERENAPQPLSESEMSAKIQTLSSDPTFSRALTLTMKTFELVLRRLGDRNVPPT